MYCKSLWIKASAKCINVNEYWELSDPPIDSNVITTIKVQKRSKDIGKIIHVTSGVQP